MSPPISGVIPSLNGRGNLTGDHFIDIEALVDTRATYTTTQGSMLVRLGIAPDTLRRFELADDLASRLLKNRSRHRVRGVESVILRARKENG